MDKDTGTQLNIMDWFYFITSVLAVWRLTHLLAKEEGPFDVILLIRQKAGNSFFGKMLDCFYCVSIWVAVPFAIWPGNGWLEKIVTWLALSGAACLLEQATTKNEGPDETFYNED
jgi:hypothetical protein